MLSGAQTLSQHPTPGNGSIHPSHHLVSTEKRNFEHTRTRRHLEASEYNWIVVPLAYTIFFPIFYFVVVRYMMFNVRIDYDVFWTPDCLLLTLIGLPGWLSTLPPLGFLMGASVPMKPFEIASRPKQRHFRRLRICLVTRGQNAQTVLGTVSKWTELQKIDDRIIWNITLDGDLPPALQGGIPSFVEVVVVPAYFTPKNARYKARALEYFRQSVQLHDDDWVFHLDEETQIDAFAVRACLDFIERSQFDIGMGAIYYNSAGHWDHPFLTTAEMLRVVADFGRFRLPISLFGRPTAGWVHGSAILIRGEVENTITWDTENVAEDFWFGVKAKKRGYNFGWMNLIAREQVPVSIMDVCRQRHRWFSGIWATKLFLPRLVYLSATWGSFGYVYSIYRLLRAVPIVVPRWVILWGVLTGTEALLSATFASLLVDFDCGGIAWTSMIWHVPAMWFFTPLYYWMEMLVMIHAIIWPSKGFHVVKKV